MRRTAINLFALLVIGIGGSYLGGVEAALAVSCSGPAGSRGCTCTSRDGKFTCSGDTCTAGETTCNAQDLGPSDSGGDEGGGEIEQ